MCLHKTSYCIVLSQKQNIVMHSVRTTTTHVSGLLLAHQNNFLITCSHDNIFHPRCSYWLRESRYVDVCRSLFLPEIAFVVVPDIAIFFVPDADNKTPAKGSTQSCNNKAAFSLEEACYPVGPNAKGQNPTPAPWPKRSQRRARAEALLALAEVA